MDLAETYLSTLKERMLKHGVPETSGYGGLETLLNEVGAQLKPSIVKTVIHARGGPGEGIADGAFFTKEEFKDRPDDTLLMEHALGRQPKRGQMEVKGIDEDLDRTAQSPQIKKYLDAVPFLLLTNYWDFRMLSRDDLGRTVEGERFTLADSADAFRAAIRQSKKLAGEKGARLVEFLKRALLHEAPLDSPKDVAWYLASYAREALGRLDEHADAAHLGQLKLALEEALGLKFEGEGGEHFFRSSLVQTLFYGIFAAWVLWAAEQGRGDKDRFDWRLTDHYLHVPAIQTIYRQVSDPRKLKPLQLEPVLAWTGEVLNRVVKEKFFAKFQQEHAVQYFYEPFLQAFDPDLRKQLG
ncbi:MAG TPA: DNA methyltransferase, partial [bacterium]|nr:DNA methyltransferase [bacterium]